MLQKGTLRLLEVMPPVVSAAGRPLVQDASGNEVEVGDVRFQREGTFEHVSNGPAAAFSYAKLPSGNATVPQNTTGNWVFAADGAALPFNEQHLAMGGLTGDHVVAVSPFAISPGNILRTMPWGLNGSNANGNAEVISINNVVRSTLDAAGLRRNYFHEGTTWTPFGASPTAGNQVGTNKLENTTMETFNQGGNCFNCHVTNTTAVSHVFNSTKPLF